MPRLLVLHDEGRRRLPANEGTVRDEKSLCLLWLNLSLAEEVVEGGDHPEGHGGDGGGRGIVRIQVQTMRSATPHLTADNRQFTGYLWLRSVDASINLCRQHFLPDMERVEVDELW
jgi:hypothetical protein